MTEDTGPSTAVTASEAGWRDQLAPPTLFALDGKVAIVTGAAGGIGRWLSAGLAAAGGRVLMTDRVAAGLEAVAARIGENGDDVATLVIDLEEADAAERIVSAAIDQFGRLDILINNAGINRRLSMLDVTPDVLADIWKIDFIRCYELAQAAARVMIRQGDGGAIVNISSLNAAVALEDVSLLGPTKAALSQLAQGMAVEFAHHGIRANAIAPGFMATPMNAMHWSDATRASWILGRTPLCRPGHPAELVGACLLLASDAGSFITGQTLFVDGGFTAGSRWSVPPDAGWDAFRREGGYCRPPVTENWDETDEVVS